MPWQLRWLAMSFTVIAGGGLLWVAYEYGHAFGGTESHSTDVPVTQTAHLEQANAALKSELAVIERQLQIERATYGDLARQIKALSDENARLKEDVAVLQAISAPDSKLDGVKVSSVRIEPNSVAGEYSYRIVLLQTGPRTKPFQGSYQLLVNLTHEGKRAGMTVPAAADERNEPPYQLDFRVHQRIDGTFKVDPTAVVRSVQVRVFEGGQSQPKVMQTVTLS